MSTRSFISKFNDDGSISGIYCHHDGYPEGVGKMLKENYSNPDKVSALLGLGDISCLGPGIHEETIAYARDMNQDFEPNATYASLNDMLQNVWDDFGAEYAYVFNGTGWSCHEQEVHS
jgi:hypothetical protein